MTGEGEYLIALFNSVSHVIRSERILLELGIPHKIIPVPKKISTECGVSIRFLPEHRESIVRALNGKTEIIDIRPL
jgi:hypothetical protein